MGRGSMSLIEDIKTELADLLEGGGFLEGDQTLDVVQVFTSDEDDPGGNKDVVEVFLQDVQRASGPFYGGDRDDDQFESTVVVQVRCKASTPPGKQRNDFMKVVDMLETDTSRNAVSAGGVEITASTTGYDDTDGEPLPYGGLTTFTYTTEADPR